MRLLVECCRAGLKAYKETQYMLNDLGDKPADLLLTTWLLGLPVALDAAKACPLSGNGI